MKTQILEATTKQLLSEQFENFVKLNKGINIVNTNYDVYYDEATKTNTYSVLIIYEFKNKFHIIEK